MKTLSRTFAVLAAALVSFVSCQKEMSFDSNKQTHKVSFTAEQMTTKTSATVNGTEVKYSWTAGDADNFTVYEVIDGTYTAATKTEGVLIDDTMTLTAEFSGVAASGAKYQAVFNSAVKATQNGSDTNYDQDSDVLVSEPVNASESDAGMLTLRFKRLVAVNKVALKGLDAGSMLGDVVIEATDGQNLVGTYSVKDAAFTDMASSLVINQGSSVVESGVAEAYFITLPVPATTLKVSAVTLDDDLNFAAAYEKTFAKTIDFQRGDLTSFGVQMNAKPAETFDLTVVGDVQASADRISWDRALVSVVDTKGSGEKDTPCNNYYPGTENKDYSSTRFYKNSTLTITPKCGVEIGQIEFTATTAGYATALANSTWTNAKASANGTAVTVVPTDKTKAVSVGITDNTGHSEIKVTFGEASVVAVTGVSFDQSELTMNVGETSTLTATVAPADAFNKDVTWSSSDDAVATVADGKVTAVAAGKATITVKTDDGSFTATCAVTVNALAKISSIAEIKAIVAEGTKDATKSFDASLTNAVVTYVNGNNAFVQDDTAGILIYLSNHGYNAGDVLSGDFAGSGYKYNGVCEITVITTKPTVTSGTAPDPAVVTFSELNTDFDKYDLKYVKVKDVTLGVALTTSNRKSTVTQGDLSFDLYAGVEKTVVLAAGLYGDMICIPEYYATSSKSTKQLVIWETEQFTAKEGPLSGISLNKDAAEISVGSTTSLTVIFTPSNAKNKTVTWTSSNTAVATVADGVVTAVAEGTATITATSAEGNYTATCAVTVLAGPVATDYSDVYSSNVTITGSKKVKIGTSEYSALQVGTSSAKGSVTFKVPANTTRLCLHVVGWNGEGEKTHTISTSVGTITPNSITTTADSGATGSSSPFSLSKTSYSSSDYYYEFELSGVTSQATITIANSAKKSRGIYFGINAE